MAWWGPNAKKDGPGSRIDATQLGSRNRFGHLSAPTLRRTASGCRPHDLSHLFFQVKKRSELLCTSSFAIFLFECIRKRHIRVLCDQIDHLFNVALQKNLLGRNKTSYRLPAHTSFRNNQVTKTCNKTCFRCLRDPKC